MFGGGDGGEGDRQSSCDLGCPRDSSVLKKVYHLCSLLFKVGISEVEWLLELLVELIEQIGFGDFAVRILDGVQNITHFNLANAMGWLSELSVNGRSDASDNGDLTRRMYKEKRG